MLFRLMRSYINIAADVVLLEGVLKNLVVICKLIVMLSIPVHFAHLNCARVNGVNDLAVDRSCSALLDLLHIQLIRIV